MDIPRHSTTPPLPPLEPTKGEITTYPSPLPLSLCLSEANLEYTALQRQNTEISKQIFPEKEYRGLSPSFHIHASVSDLYIPTISLPILLEEICRPILGLYKSLTDT
jgi:hypothetical protein